ncbi:MAG: hypothetical protein J5636_05360 [Clostridiales bacterium]|nr:hypothetical protein [Clostridiales bacterium]
MKKFFKRVYWKICSIILRLMDEASDKRICGQSLVKYVKSVYRDDANGVGMTGSQSTHYIILKRIFSHVTITEKDSFMDIGCGKGRVLAFLLKKHAPCKISGIEINEISGKVAQEWTKKYEQVNVTLGDAFEIDYDSYTILFMGRPFLPKTFLQFIEHFESGLTHPITLIYWVDQQSGYLLKDRPGWEKQFREKLSTIHGLKVAQTPQGYSVWTYDPALRAEAQKQ